MPTASHNRLAAPLVDLVENHNCAYAQRVISVDERHQVGLSAYRLFGLIDRVQALHSDGVCPPTHVDGSPTEGWADLVHDTQI